MPKVDATRSVIISETSIDDTDTHMHATHESTYIVFIPCPVPTLPLQDPPARLPDTEALPSETDLIGTCAVFRDREGVLVKSCSSIP